MSDESAAQSPDRQARLEQLLADYLHSVENGQPLDRSAVIAAHPELADDLQSFFRNRDSIDRLAEPLKAAAEAPTIAGPSNIGAAAAGNTVRYFGDYELLTEIARGGMGVVYKARQVNLNRIVALKMILAGQLATPEDVKRFHAEAEAAANLQHPNIVAIHEVGEHEGQHYFSMDYVDGRSLADIVRQHPLSARKAAEYVKTIATAIQYAHEQRTLHRDLKPSNILIDAQDQPRITDFGLAKKIEGDSNLTASGAVLGTPSYMPPEQAGAKRGQIGPASDVYALGAVLYDLLTGRPPFRAETPLDTLLQVLDNEPAAPRLLNPDVPADLETICLKCLEKNPAQRYGSAQDLADDLGRFLNREPIQARPASSARKVWSWSKRRPWLFAGLASIFALGLITFASWLWVQNEYLRWVIQHPDYVRQIGPRTEKLIAVDSGTSWLTFVMIFAIVGFNSHVRRRKLEGSHISPASLAGYGALGTISVADGLYVLLLGIDAYVWEAPLKFSTFMSTYGLSYFGMALAWRAFREYESFTFGADADADLTQLSELPKEKIDEISELLFADKKHRAVSAYIKASGNKATGIRATRARFLDARQVINRFEIELFRKHPEKAPPDRSAVILKGCLVLFVVVPAVLFGLPLLLLLLIGGVLSGDPRWIAGLAGYVAAVAATSSFLGNNRRFRRDQAVFPLLLVGGLAVMAVYHPVLSILAGAAIGVISGIAFGYCSRLSRVARAKRSEAPPAAPAVDWKARLKKLVKISSLLGFVSGLVLAIVLVASGASGLGELQFRNGGILAYLALLFLAMPAALAAICGILAGIVMGLLQLLDWVMGGTLSRE